MVPLLKAPHLESPHGFTSRAGGVSTGPFATLNLSQSVGDDPRAVDENRRRVLAAFGAPPLVRLSQVHGSRAVTVEAPGVYEADAAVTRTLGLLLSVSAADCYPLLLEDPGTGAVGVAHAGWRGVAAGVVENVVAAMEGLGAKREALRVAIGPGACGRCYQVGPEVARAVGPAFARPDETAPGRYLLDLLAAIRARLLALGLAPENVWALDACTIEDARFFSYRRQGKRSGRMWGLIQRAPL